MPRDLDKTIRLTQEVLEQPSLTAARFLGHGDGQQHSCESYGDLRRAPATPREVLAADHAGPAAPLRLPVSVHLGFSQRSLSAQTKRNLAQTLHYTPGTADDQPNVIGSPLVETSSEVKHVAISKDGKLQALFRVTSAKEGKEARQVVEIVETESGRRVEELEVTKEHGDWYFDGALDPVSRLQITHNSFFYTYSYLWRSELAPERYGARLHRRSSSAQAGFRGLVASAAGQVQLHARLWRDLHRQARADAFYARFVDVAFRERGRLVGNQMRFTPLDRPRLVWIGRIWAAGVPRRCADADRDHDGLLADR